MAKVNVIITCYNKEQTIARAIELVKRQTFTDFFCIVVDDGSTDSSWEIISKAIAEDKRFIAVKLKNCGVANARNYGIGLGNAPYITCLDGDDGLDNSFLQVCYEEFQKQNNNVGIVYTDLLLAHIDSYFTVARWQEANPNEQFNGHNQVPCCNMFRRDIFERLGGYRQRYAPKGAGAEDAEMWLRFFKLGYTAKKVTNEPLFIYNTYGGLTQNMQYQEVNWLNWHTTQPFSSLQNPDNGIAHIVNEYDEPEISVIIPVGPGHEHYLIDALDSLEAQTFQNWEAIVIFDNADFDSTLNTSYPYVNFVYNGTGKHGAGIARNIGIKQAKGKYIVFLDADDYLQPKFLELTLSALKHFNVDWVYTDLYTQTIYNEAQYKMKVNELDTQRLFHKVLRAKNDWVEFIYRYECDEWSIDKLFNGGVAAVTALYKKQDILDVGGFEEEHNREDWDLHFRLAKAGKCGLRLPLPLFTYRLHTGTRREYKYDDAIDFKTGKQLDVKRLNELYDKEELKMACTSCKKNKIVIKKVPDSDLTTLEYIGKIAGGSIKGVTGSAYQIDHFAGKNFINKVHPQDAQEFIARGICQPLPVQKHKTDPIVSPTPQKIEVIELSREERLKAVNDRMLAEQEKIRQEIEAMFFSLDKASDEALEITEKETDFYLLNHPDEFTVRELKEFLSIHELEPQELKLLLNNEQQLKNRKSAIKAIAEHIE